MKLFTEIVDIKKDSQDIVVALGTFDGLHIGHQQIIGEAVKWAVRHNGTSVVFTFSNHPLSLIAPHASPKLIYSNISKVRLIEEMGVDLLFNIPFTPQLLQLTPEEFIDLLHRNLKPRQIIVGPNYSFGFKGKGTPEMLEQEGSRFGFTVKVPSAVTKDGMVVSSTVIRQLLSEGHVKMASELLGRQYALYDMKVVTGERRGRSLGFPTANIEIPSSLIVPSDGVYAVKVRYKSVFYIGVANIGSNPTFETISRRIEVHLLDFSEDIYGQTIDILFFDKLRNEIRFDSLEELQVQISKDVKSAAAYFSNK